MQLEVDVKIQGPVVLVYLQGEFDLQEAGRLRQEVDPYLISHEVAHLVFNLTQVSFIDSSGVGSILGRYRKMKEKGGRVSIVGANPMVEKVLIFSGIQKIIPLYPAQSSVPVF